MGAIQSVETARDVLVLTWQDGTSDRLNLFWLRDNCPTAGDRNSALRHFSLKDMPTDLGIGSCAVGADGTLQIVWSPDGHESSFDPDWLWTHRPGQRGTGSAQLWDHGLQNQLPVVDHASIDEGNEGHLQLLQNVARFGFTLVENIPDDEAATEALLNRIGFVQENDFGRIFNIVSEPDLWELSQTDLALDVHTDDPFRHTPPGVSLLHCVDSAADGGGVSQLADGFAVAEKFREDDPEGFELLATVAVPFIRYREDPVPQGDDVYQLTEAPIISVDSHGAISGIRFHERSMAALDLPPDLMARIYPALIAFAKRLYAAESQISHALQPGEAVIFDNHRVLHGRTAFDGSAGRRHMRLTQTTRDQFHSRLRLLRSRHGRPGADERLPTGALP